VQGAFCQGAFRGNLAYIMAQQMKSDAELSGAIIMLSTLCSLVTYTFALYFLQFIGV
jgi:hypothetical protein